MNFAFSLNIVNLTIFNMKASMKYLMPSTWQATWARQLSSLARVPWIKALGCVAAGCCLMVTALHAQTQSGVIILVGEITAPTCVWQPRPPTEGPQVTAHLTRNCQHARPQADEPPASHIAQVRETLVGDMPSLKRVFTVGYW